MKTAVATTTIQTPTPVSRSWFTNRRATAFGIQYQTKDEQLVTVNGAETSCTCGMEKFSVVCTHRIAALAQEKIYEQEAKARTAYCREFAIY